MLKLLADENFHNHVLRGLRRQLPEVDVLRAQDVPELAGSDDSAVLEWADRHGRVLLTHDLKTIHRFVLDRLQAGATTAGVIFVPQPFSLAQVIDDLVLLSICSTAEELAERTFTYLPWA